MGFSQGTVKVLQGCSTDFFSNNINDFLSQCKHKVIKLMN